MRFFTFIIASAMVLTAFGAGSQRHAFKSNHVQVAPKAADDYYDDDYDDYDYEEPVYEAPEGELTLLQRECEGWITESFEASHNRIVGSTVEMVEAEDGTVWLNHMISEYPVDTWIPATRQDNTLTISGAQLLYIEYDEDTDDEYLIYVVPMRKVIDEATQTGTYVATDDLTYTFNIGEDGSFTSADPELLLGLAVKNPQNESIWVWKGFGDYNITMSAVTAKPVELPEGITTETWVWEGPYDIGFAQVAIDGNDIYVSGMDRDIPDAWIKGTIVDGKAVFPSGQYMGPDYEMYYLHYFCGAEIEQVYNPDTEEYETLGRMTDEVTFIYDAENKVLTLEGEYMMNASPDRLYPLVPYDSIVVRFQTRDVNAAPAAPYDLEYNFEYGEGSLRFMLPATDVNGALLFTDKLFYEILVDGEPLEFTLYDDNYEEYQSTRLPYKYSDWYDIWVDGMYHSVYIYTEPQKSIAIRSVYINENDETITGAPCVYDLTSVGDIATERTIVDCSWFDLQGRRIEKPAKGIAIRVTTFSDGSIARDKVAL